MRELLTLAAVYGPIDAIVAYVRIRRRLHRLALGE